MSAGRDDRTEDLARAIYVASSGLRDLQPLAEEPENRPQYSVSFADLAHAVIHPESSGASIVVERAAADAASAAQCETLYRRLALTRFDAVAAASSGVISVREAGPFRLRLEPSAGRDDVLYLLIERTDGGVERPASLAAIAPRGHAALLPLPGAESEAEGEIIQLLLPPDAPLIRAFRDPDARLYLL